jgi:hypothetical protein
MKTQGVSALVLRVIVICLAAMYIWLTFGAPDLNRDVALILTAGERIAHGALPYVDVIDINPPTAFYVSTIPAFVSSLLGIPLAYAGFYFWWFIITGSLGMMIWLIAKIFPKKGAVDFLFLTAVIILSTILIYAREDYAERDHVIILWLVCFALVRYARYEQISVPLWAATGSGLAAGIALAMKPQYVILPVLIELCCAFWNGRLLLRWRDWELPAGIMMAAVLFLHPFLFPSMAAGAMDWLKITMLGYDAYAPPSLENILREVFSDRAELISLVVSLALAWLALLGRKSTVFRGSSLFGILALASFAVMLIQHRGTPYHHVPYRFCAMVGLGFLITDVTVFFRGKYWSGVLAIVTLLLLPFTLSAFDIRMLSDKFSSRQGGKFAYNDFTDIICSLSKPGEPVMFISSTVYPAFPAITYADRRSTGRLPIAFPIPFMYHGTEGYSLPPRWKELEPRILRMFVEDIRREKPAVLFISKEKGTQGLPLSFDIKDYLSLRGFDDSLRSDYVSIGSYRNFEIRIRTPYAYLPEGTIEKRNPDSLEVVQLLRHRKLLIAPGDTTEVNR